MRTIILLVAIGMMSACTFVKMGPGGDAIKVAPMGRDMGDCKKLYEITVSVKDRLGPYERDTLRVRDELEVLARNEAPSLKADTVQAIGPVNDGTQKWNAFRCNGSDVSRDPGSPDKATTQPLKD